MSNVAGETDVNANWEKGENSQQSEKPTHDRRQIDPELYQAASRGDVALLERLIGSETQPHAEAPPDETVIEVENVAAMKSTEVHLLLGVTHAGDTALHIATWFGHHEVAQWICNKNKLLLMQGNDKAETPLHYAAQAGNLKLVTLFIQLAKEEGGSFVAELLIKINRGGETALYQAIYHCQVFNDNNHFHATFIFFQLRIWNAKLAKEEEHSHVKVVKMLLDAESAVADCFNNRGLLQPASIPNKNSISPLYLAIMQNSLPIVTSLLDRLLPESASWAAYSGPDKRTALHAAALRNKGFIEVVVRWKSQLTKSTDKLGSTPLHYSASANNLEAVKLLLKTDKTSAYIADASGLYPIHVAAKLGWELLVAEFFEQCPDSDELLDREGRNFLHLAVEEKKESVVRWVFERSKLVKAMNSQDNEGNTPMHLAVKAQDVKIFSLLLGSKKTLKSIMNKDGWTPLDVAVGNRMIGLFHMQHPKYIISRTLNLSGCSSGIHRRDHFNLIHDSLISPEEEEKEAQDLENMARSMAVGSTLIPSAAFTGYFTVSTTYINSQAFSCHRNPGLSLAFKTFTFMVAYAFICAIIAMALFVHAAITYLDPKYRKKSVVICSQFVTEAIRSFIVAFALGVLVMMSIVSQWRLACVVCLICSGLLVFPQPHLLPNISVQRALLRYLGIKSFILVGGFGFFSNISYGIIVLLVLFAEKSSKADLVEHIVVTIVIGILFLLSSPLFLPFIGYFWNHRPKPIRRIRIEKRFFLVIPLSLVTYLVLFFPIEHISTKSWSPHMALLTLLVSVACQLLVISFSSIRYPGNLKMLIFNPHNLLLSLLHASLMYVSMFSVVELFHKSYILKQW